MSVAIAGMEAQEYIDRANKLVEMVKEIVRIYRQYDSSMFPKYFAVLDEAIDLRHDLDIVSNSVVGAKALSSLIDDLLNWMD